VSVEDVAEVGYDDSLGVRWLLLRRLLAPPEEVARAILASARGHRVVTDDDALVALLVEAGGTIQRRGHDYAYDVATAPPDWTGAPAPPGYALTREIRPQALVEAHAASTPPGHPDHEPDLDHEADLRSMVDGTLLGPLVREASWQVEHEGRAVGAVLVTDKPGERRRGWVVDVFLHPENQGRGLGRVLLQRAVAGTREAGLPELGLVVSDGNPARHVYDALGFRHVRSGTNVDLPLLS